MDGCVDDMTPPLPTNDADFVFVIHKSGKWVAKIRHPIRKVWVCVGVYSNHEEAADACARKKVEYESHSVQETDASFHTNVEDFEKHTGVKHSASSGKWWASIKHQRVQVWLGSYNTPNEAVDAFNLSKLELQSPKVGSLRKVGGSVDLDPRCELGLKTQDAQEAVSRKKCELVSNGDAEQSERNQRRRHAYVRKSGRWQTDIMHPMKKGKNIYLGTFDTAEEAEEAYNSTKRQFELMFPGYMNCKQSKESVHLGTLTEETGEAYNNKMREVDLIVRAHKKPKQSKGSCKADAVVGDESDAPDLENCKLDSGFGSSSLKDGIMQAVSSPFAAAHKREVGSRGSVYKDKSGKWKAEIQIRKVRNKLGTFATAEDAREALNQKKCELGLKGEDAEEALNQKKCELGLNGDAEQSERNQRRRHAYVRESGRWRTEIRHPMKKAKKIYLGTFDTAEKAEDAYDSTRRKFELMFPGYMKSKQSNDRVHLGTLTQETEEAYNNTMREVDLIVRAHKKPKQLKGGCKADLIAEGNSDDPFVCTNESSVIKAGKEEDVGGDIVKEETGEFDLGVIDSCGQLVGEYSKMDDELWIC